MATPTSFFISIGSQRCTAARIVAQGSSLRIESIASREFPVDQGSDAARAAHSKNFIEQLAAELDCKKGESVRVVLSAQHVYTKWVSVPKLVGRSTEQIIELEAKQEIPFPLESVCWSYWYPEGEEVGSGEALVAAVRQELVDQISDATQAAGLDLACIEISPFALKNAFQFNYPESDESKLIIDFGAKVTSLIFLEKDNFYLRTPSVGGSSLTSQLARELGIEVEHADQLKLDKGVVGLAGFQVARDDEQEVISKILRTGMTRLQTEITRTLSVWRSQQSGGAPEKIYLAGGSSAMPYALEFLEEKMNVSIDYLNAFARIELSETISEQERSGLSYLVGDLVGSALSANSLAQDRLEIVPELVTKKLEIRRKQPYFIASILLLVAGFALFIFSNITRKSNAEKVVSENRVKLSEVESLNSRVQRLMNSEGSSYLLEKEDGHLKLAKLAESYQGLIDKRSYWVRFLHDFNERFDSEVVWLTSLNLGYYFFDDSGQVIVNDLGEAEGASPNSVVEEASRQSRVRKIPAAGVINLTGLYRGNSRLLVFEEFDDLQANDKPSPWLLFEDFSGEEISVEKIDAFDPSQRYGASFSISLPLARPVPIDPLITLSPSEEDEVSE